MVEIRRISRLLVLPVAIGGVVAGPLSGPATGAESFAGTFGAVAAADAVQVVFIVPHAPASDTVVDAGGPSAQAVLDSVGTSQAFASFPYPGENAVTAPSLIAGASGGAVNLPAYPFYVGSTYPISPSAESGSGPYMIKAESTETSSAATASVGLAVEGQGALGLAKSQASTVSAPEAVTADSSSEVTSFAVGPLHLGQVLSNAKVVLGADGTFTREADTRVIGAMVADTPVALTPQGAVVAGSSVPGVDMEPVQQLLAQAKITVEIMPREEVEGGVVAPIVRVTQRDDAGMSITYVLGGASAFAEGAGVVEDEFVDETGTTESAEPSHNDASFTVTPSEPLVSGAELEPTAEVALPVSFVVPFEGATTAGVGGASSVAPPSDVSSTSGAEALADASPEAASRGRVQLASRLLISGSDTTPLFWVLALALIAALAASVLVRRFGSRTG